MYIPASWKLYRALSYILSCSSVFVWKMETKFLFTTVGMANMIVIGNYNS
jgi:hypothetical protein